MSRSLDLPMMISRFIRSGNSPHWYLPEMKRSAKRGRSFMELALVPRLDRWRCDQLQGLENSSSQNASGASKRGSIGGGCFVAGRFMRWPQRIDDAPVDFFGDHQARV